MRTPLSGLQDYDTLRGSGPGWGKHTNNFNLMILLSQLFLMYFKYMCLLSAQAQEDIQSRSTPGILLTQGHTQQNKSFQQNTPASNPETSGQRKRLVSTVDDFTDFVWLHFLILADRHTHTDIHKSALELRWIKFHLYAWKNSGWCSHTDLDLNWLRLCNKKLRNLMDHIQSLVSILAICVHLTLFSLIMF